MARTQTHPAVSTHPRLHLTEGAPSWRIATSTVDAFVTRAGGHLAPVTFKTSRGAIQPYAIAPWATGRDARKLPPLLRSLRGDFFCLPFGDNATDWRGERHPPHGETAAGVWRAPALRHSDLGVEFSARMRVRSRPGVVTKRIWLRHGETNVYCEHELVGFDGPMCLGHHATLRFPSCGNIATSPWRHGQVSPVPFESPARGGYSALKVGARFSDLRRVPLANGGQADLTVYPAREGFEDLVMISADPKERFAWTTVTFPEERYLWFGFKDPRTLASTVMWHSNGGRHYAPWNGRHRHVLGLEEITGYFHLGLAASAAKNPVSQRGIPTVLSLHRTHPLAIRYVMGVAQIPRNFDSVAAVELHGDFVIFRAASGARITHRVDVGFVAGVSRP